MPSIKELYKRLNDVKIDADSINLNTDGLESLLATTQADVALIKADMADGVAINQPVSVTDNNGSLTVDGTVTAVLSTDTIFNDGGDRLNVGLGSVAGIDPANWLKIDGGSVPISGTVTANAGTGTFAVSASSLPLPSGAATSANQTTANTSLANIDADIGSTSDSAATTDSGTFSLISLFKRLLSTKIPDQSSGRIPVTLSSAGTNGSTAPTSSNLFGGTDGTNLRAVSTDSSGRINTNINGTVAVSDRGTTGETSVTNFTSTTSATLKASNSNRRLLTIYNEGAGNLHILYGSGTASTTNYSVRLSTGDYLEVDKYTGQLTAIFASAGTARVTEIT